MGRKLTQTEFIDRCKVIHPEYIYDKTIYINARTNVIITCPIHGDFITTPNRFIMGSKSGCPKCNPSSLKESLTQEEFIQRCLKYFPNYDYSQVVYTNQYTKVVITCNKHNYTWKPIAKDLMNGHGCPLCGKENNKEKQKLTLEEFIEKANKIHNNKYDYSKVLYINYKTKVEIVCPIHGSFLQSPDKHLIQQQGCPKCEEQSSKGELQVKNYLENHNIKYIQQYPIIYNGNCNNKTKIDFYLPDYNIFIEYNGMQHYVPIDYFGGELKFQKQIQRDNYVRNYCKEYNIKLIEIKYNDNLINILNDELGLY